LLLKSYYVFSSFENVGFLYNRDSEYKRDADAGLDKRGNK